MNYGRTLARTDDGDVRVENGEAVWLDGLAAVEQQLKTTLKTIRGEDPFDSAHGFDVLEAVGAAPAVIEREVRIALDEDDRVDSVDSVTVGEPTPNRVRQIDATVTLVDGSNLSLSTAVEGS